VRFEVGQAEALGDFEDASFDAVCMSSVLHWVSDKAKALAEIRRVLRPGGRLGVTTIPHELSHAGTVALVLQPLLRRPPYAGHVDLSALASGKRCTSTDLVSLVLESGLELVELHVTHHVSRHESGAAFVAFAEASSFGNFLRIVPEDLRASLRADVVSGFDGQRPTASSFVVGGCFLWRCGRDGAGPAQDDGSPEKPGSGGGSNRRRLPMEAPPVRRTWWRRRESHIPVRRPCGVQECR
jgi:SAM-dependent methyltransferase